MPVININGAIKGSYFSKEDLMDAIESRMCPIFRVPTLNQQLDCHILGGFGDRSWNLESAHPSDPDWGAHGLGRLFFDSSGSFDPSASRVCNWSE